MRRLYFCLLYTWLNTGLGSEHFVMDRILWRPQRDKIAVHIPQEGGWSTHVKVSCDGNGELLQTRELNWSMQHRLAVYWLAFESPKFLADVD
jgi:hypothetical protein